MRNLVRAIRPDSTDVYLRLIAALERGGYSRHRPHRYRCPACGAERNGLRVSHAPAGNRKVLLTCGNGCPLDEILEPLGLTPSDICEAD